MIITEEASYETVNTLIDTVGRIINQTLTSQDITKFL